MINYQSRNTLRKKRKLRVRTQTKGTVGCPRLCVYKSLKHLHVQLIDDTAGHTLLFLSTLSTDVKKQFNGKTRGAEKAKLLGKIFAQKAREKKIEKITFDRNGFSYHGNVKALADGAREGGLKF